MHSARVTDADADSPGPVPSWGVAVQAQVSSERVALAGTVASTIAAGAWSTVHAYP